MRSPVRFASPAIVVLDAVAGADVVALVTRGIHRGLEQVNHTQSVNRLRVESCSVKSRCGRHHVSRTHALCCSKGGREFVFFICLCPPDRQSVRLFTNFCPGHTVATLSVCLHNTTHFPLCGKKSSPYGTRTRVSSDRFSMKARYTNPCTNKDFEMVASGIAIPIALATLVPTRCQLSSAQLGRPQVQSLRAYRYSSNFEATPERVGSWSVIFIDMFTRCPFRPVVVSLAFWACSNHTYVRIESLQRARGPAVPKRNDSKLAIVRLTSIKESSHTKIHRSLII